MVTYLYALWQTAAERRFRSVGDFGSQCGGIFLFLRHFSICTSGATEFQKAVLVEPAVNIT